MELNFSVFRVLILVTLIVAFALLGGFTPPDVGGDSMFSPARIAKAWRYCVLLFLAGAVCVSIVDHFVGTLDRTNLRLLYIIVGIVLMGGSFIYLQNMRASMNVETVGFHLQSSLNSSKEKSAL